MIFSIKLTNYLIFYSILLEIIKLKLSTITCCNASITTQLNRYTVISFNSSSFPVDSNKALLISTKHHIFVEINSFDKRFRIIAKIIDSEQENNIYLGRIYMKHNSNVIGYVKNNVFFGVIKVDGIRYNLESISNSDQIYLKGKDSAVMYRDDSVVFDYINDSVLKSNISSKAKKFTSKQRFKNRLIGKNANLNKLPKNKVCGLDLYADTHFTKMFGTLGAIAEMLIIVREANEILSRIDFDGDGYPDNIGVAAVRWTVSDSREDEFGLHVSETDAKKLIRKFQRRSTDNCLQVLFTHQNLMLLDKGIVGLANLNGICAKQVTYEGQLITPNAVLVTSLSDNRPLNRVQRIIDLTHEIGHTFGAKHDNEDYKMDSTCNPSAKDGGTFIMSTLHEDITYQVSDLKNKQKFSLCSKDIMRKVLSNSERNHCFIMRAMPKCGDLEVDRDEECDGGTKELSQLIDPCCEPTGSSLQCKTKQGIECHPREGSCCDVNTCKFYHWKQFPQNCRIDCFEPAFCLGKSAKCPVTTPLTSGAMCWNCSSDDCICNRNGNCINRYEKPMVPMTQKTTNIYYPTIRRRTNIHKVRNIVFSVLIILIVVVLSIFCWIYGCIEYIVKFLRQIYRRISRQRTHYRPLIQELRNYDDSEASDDLHEN